MDVPDIDSKLREVFRRNAAPFDTDHAVALTMSLARAGHEGPPPKRTVRRVALAAVTVILVAGLGVGAYLATRHLGSGDETIVFTDPTLPISGIGTTETAVTTDTTVSNETVQLYPVRVDGKWGFIDKTGTIRIEPQFADLYQRYGGDTFSDGLAPAAVGEGDDEKWGYIDTSGAWVVDPQWDYAKNFSEGLAVVGNKTGLDGDLFMEYGYIDSSGTLVIPIERNTASDFSEGLAMFTEIDVGYPSYFLDKTGAPVLGPFDFALPFSEGLAYVEWGDRCGFIDKTGARVIELPEGFGRCQHSSCSFSEGLAAVASSEGGVERHVFVDTSGTVVIEPQYDYAGDFFEGLAVAAVQEGDDIKWGYIDKTGAWVIEPQFYMAHDFSEGLAAVMYIENSVSTYGYIDATGTMVIAPRQCVRAEPFSGDVAALMGLGNAGDETPSYIDKTGKVIWQGE
jgi:hypothetical protein